MPHQLATAPGAAAVEAVAQTPDPVPQTPPIAEDAALAAAPVVPRNFRWTMVWNNLPMIAAHFVCFAAIWTGVTTTDLLVCFVLYWVRMFGVTAGYHRFFSHRAYKMGRIQMFFMALLAQSSAQKGCLWWAAHHRHHHKHSDEADDHHSPSDGFWWSHIGWILAPEYARTDYSRIGDLAKYPELRFLNKFHMLPAIALGFAVYALFGWSGLVVGFFWSTVILWHGTFTINSLAHVIGTRDYDTTDDSKNHWFLAIITMGEGWHNNHHHYQSSTAQGFRWWQIDMTYSILKVLSYTGLVSGVRRPPPHVIEQSVKVVAASPPLTDAPAAAAAEEAVAAPAG